MCGIVGIIAAGKKLGFDAKQIDQFVEMMYINTLRGVHGSGAFAVTNKGKLHWSKSAALPHYFLAEAGKKVMETALKDGWALVGHCRSATFGEINDENAHPFNQGDITLVHNGTLEKSQPSLKGMDDFKVDSDWLCHQIDKVGPEEAFAKIRGAMACIYWDAKNPKVLYAYRNYQRPLHVTLLPEENVVYFNSEPAPLDYIRFKHDKKNFAIHQLSAERLYTFDLENGGYTQKEIKIHYSASNYSGGNYSHHNWNNRNGVTHTQQQHGNTPPFSGGNNRSSLTPEEQAALAHERFTGGSNTTQVATVGKVVSITPKKILPDVPKKKTSEATTKPASGDAQIALVKEAELIGLEKQLLNDRAQRCYKVGGRIKVEVLQANLGKNKEGINIVAIPLEGKDTDRVICRGYWRTVDNKAIVDEHFYKQVVFFEATIDRIQFVKDRTSDYDIALWMTEPKVTTPSEHAYTKMEDGRSIQMVH